MANMRLSNQCGREQKDKYKTRTGDEGLSSCSIAIANAVTLTPFWKRSSVFRCQRHSFVLFLLSEEKLGSGRPIELIVAHLLEGSQNVCVPGWFDWIDKAEDSIFNVNID
jgi:hypothetical protein